MVLVRGTWGTFLALSACNVSNVPENALVLLPTSTRIAYFCPSTHHQYVINEYSDDVGIVHLKRL